LTESRRCLARFVRRSWITQIAQMYRGYFIMAMIHNRLLGSSESCYLEVNMTPELLF
jgi:hypothetical protein